MAAQQQKPLTLRRNFSWTFVGNVVYAACQWGMLVALAKLGSPEIVGQFTLGLALTAPVFMFTNLQLSTVQITDVKHQYVFGDYLGLRLLSTGLALAIILCITLSAGYRWETSLVILAVGLAKAFESISDVFYALIQKHERMDRMAISMILKGLLSVLMLSVGVYLTHSVFWGAVGLAVAWAAILFSIDIGNGSLMLKTYRVTPEYEVSKVPDSAVGLRPRWQLGKLKKLVWLALPLGFVMMLVSLNTNIPRYFIERYLGERELGLFAAISYLMVAGRIVVSALGASATPRLAKYYAQGNITAFRTLILKLVGIAVVLGGLGVLISAVAGKQILLILYRPEYAEHSDLFVWLMGVAGINYIASFLGYAITAARYFRIQMPLFSFVIAVSVVGCLWLLPTSGLLGSAIALLISAIVEVGLTCAVLLHALHRCRKNPE